MKVIRSVPHMQSIALSLHKQGRTIGLVPTMGALHQGHLSLITRARKENDVVIVSIFVNPAQFGPHEDYLRYPRPFEKDRALCKQAGVDYLFAPEASEMYPPGYLTYVTVEKISETLCGAFRPGHFRGVATVVARLFNIARPDKAYFGKKDYQQVKIIERMVQDLNIPVKVVPCPIVREPSGLALSSRNQYLSSPQREHSLILSRALQDAADLILCAREKNAAKIIRKIKQSLNKIPDAAIDYVAVLDPARLEPMKEVRLPAVIAAAVWVGKTRLIDNKEIFKK